MLFRFHQSVNCQAVNLKSNTIEATAISNIIIMPFEECLHPFKPICGPD